MTKQEVIKYAEDLGFFPDMLDIYEDEDNTILISSRGAIPRTPNKHELKLIGHIMKGKVTYYA